MSYLIKVSEINFVSNFQHLPAVSQVGFTQKTKEHATNFSKEMGLIWVKEIQKIIPSATLIPRSKVFDTN